jgi:glycyl-tRNA synthetase beta chain
MGRYYALAANEDARVADAIRDHYKPQGPNDSVPSEPTAVCVALADKLDTLIGMFAIGEKPTGSKDPFALRRAALGVIRIVLENGVRLPLKPVLAHIPKREIALLRAHEKLSAKTDAKLADTDFSDLKVGKYLTLNETAHEDITEEELQVIVDSLYAFIADRLKVQLKDSGIRHDVISAALAGGDDDLVRVVNRAKALQGFLDTEDGKNLLAGYTRASKILAIEEKKDDVIYNDNGLRTSMFKDAEEIALLNAVIPAREAMRAAGHAERYVDAMQQLATLREPVDAFFEKILVNCEDTDLRENRLRLLGSIRDFMHEIADFSKIEG